MKALINSLRTGPVNSSGLKDALLRKRKSTIIHELGEKVVLTEEMENGSGFTFNYSEEILFRLAEFINLEREDFPFLIFNLSFAANSGTVNISVRGPEGTKNMVKDELEMQ